MNKQRTAEDVWEAISHNVALDEAEEQAPESERDRQWSEGLARSARAQIERMRHAFLSRASTGNRRLVSKPELQVKSLFLCKCLTREFQVHVGHAAAA